MWNQSELPARLLYTTKLHVGVDIQGWIVASTVTESHAQDPSQVPALLSQVDYRIERFIGDGIFDQAPVYTAVENHSRGARVIIPPRKDAVLSPTATTAPTQRDQHLLAIEREGRCGLGHMRLCWLMHRYGETQRFWLRLTPPPDSGIRVGRVRRSQMEYANSEAISTEI
jgi:hypothetical protein